MASSLQDKGKTCGAFAKKNKKNQPNCSFFVANIETHTFTPVTARPQIPAAVSFVTHAYKKRRLVFELSLILIFITAGNWFSWFIVKVLPAIHA